MSITEILEAALSLRPTQRARLVAALLETLDDGAAPFQNATAGELLARLKSSSGSAWLRTTSQLRKSLAARRRKAR